MPLPNLKIITVVSEKDNDGHRQLIRSLQYFKYPYDVLVHPFQFGRQMQYVYQYAKNNWGWFLYTDGWDTFALAGRDELESKIPEGVKCILSAEKNCYPNRDHMALYPPTVSEWRYVNGGGFMAECGYFVKMIEDGKHQAATSNDQEWLSERYIRLQNDPEVMLDTQCKIFQTIAFENTWDFEGVLVSDADGGLGRIRVRNKHTGEMPIFFHGNAHTPMDKIYKLLP